MPQLKEADLKKQLKENTLDRFYFLYGDEKFLIAHYTQKLIDKVVPKAEPGFNYQIFEGDTATIDEVAEAVEALPLMAQRKCVLLKDLDVEALKAQDGDKLKELLSDLPDTTVFIISETTLSFDQKRSAKWRGFLADAAKTGAAVELPKRGEVALSKQLVSWAQKQGCTISQILAGKVIGLCGSELIVLKNEMEKLCAYCAGREITERDIELVVTKNLETTVFYLSKAILNGESDRAFRQLDLLFYQKEEPIAVLSVLTMSYADLYRVSAAAKSGESLSVLQEDFDYKRKEFRIKNAERDVRRYSVEALRESLMVLLETDLRLKGSRMDKRIIMEEMLSKLLLAAKKG